MRAIALWRLESGREKNVYRKCLTTSKVWLAKMAWKECQTWNQCYASSPRTCCSIANAGHGRSVCQETLVTGRRVTFTVPPPLNLPYPTKPNHNKAVCYVFRKQTFVYLSVYLQIFVR